MVRPTLRQFIIAAVAQGCREKVAQGEVIGWKGPLKARYLAAPTANGEVIAILPNIRDSDLLTPTMLAQLVRVLGVTGFDEVIEPPK